ncbi:hypothetical protein EC973_002892 [Apophysomyces ossiformis]|uniref:Uncharacterized protein n=1 Tax=Apophysomyces ossiformis TaxID=679940 RepID=A0A8H7BHS5_9FUNG|nr:hypothetical protein EC973_002892 [Apophysomyces ossiformis]
MLRPAKIFSSFHQLRHYLQSKVTELVEPTVKALPSSQHHLVNRIQLSVTPPKAPILQVIAEQEKKRLLKAIQGQFPVFKVFSTPAIGVPPQYNLSFARACQHRTLYASGHGVEFHRMALFGNARSQLATRQFSTSRVVDFSAQNSQSVFAHITSRFFAPFGSKMNHHGSSELSSAEDDRVVLRRRIQDDRQGKLLHESTSAFPVNKQSVSGQSLPMASISASMAEFDDTAEKNDGSSLTTVPYSQKLVDCGYIRDDDFSAKHRAERHGQNELFNRKANQQEQKTSGLYLSVVVDGLAQGKISHCFSLSDGVLNAAVLRSVVDMAEWHRVHFNRVIALLRCIRRHDELAVEIVDGEIRVFLPSDIRNLEMALRWLRSIGVDTDNPCFTLHREDGEMASQYPHSIHGQQALADNDSSLISSAILGPEYFKDIQLFLDHVDDLIENSAAFNYRKSDSILTAA